MDRKRNFKREHDVLTDAYYHGNKAGLTPGEFIRLHDSMWVDQEEEAGEPATDVPLEEQTSTFAERIAAKRQDIEQRATAADRAKADR